MGTLAMVLLRDRVVAKPPEKAAFILPASPKGANDGLSPNEALINVSG
jgi:hypothetical protein